MFDLFGGKLAIQEPEPQPEEGTSMESLLTSDDVLLNELLGMGYTYSDSLGSFMTG